MRGSEWTLPIDKGFTGQVIEPGLGLHDYVARHYAQSLGRWIAPDTVVPDPSNPQTFNRYSYVLGNPIALRDPSGHCASSENSAKGCPSWMPDWTFKILGMVAELTVMGNAYAPASEGQPGNLRDLSEKVDDRWYQGVGLGVVDVVDLADTLDKCTTGECSGWAVVGAVTPGVSGGLARKVGPRLAGQLHHVFSNKIVSALDEHATLKGVFGRDDIVTQALEGPSHRGYQAWHRGYDQEVVDWLAGHRETTRHEFLEFLQSIYNRDDMLARFPDAVEQIKRLLEASQ